MHAANSVSDSTTGNSNTADHNAAFSRFASCLALQRSAYQADPVPQLKQRLADLDALKALIRDNEQALVDAVNADYGSRCKFETRFSEILMVLEDISRTQKQLKKWLKPQKRHIDRLLFPTSSCKVLPQPLGVVGVIVPWNFPIMLSEFDIILCPFCPYSSRFPNTNSN